MNVLNLTENYQKRIDISFDQFQRYNTVAKLIDYKRNKKESDCFSVLEVGANEHKNLKLFLPNDKILFTDISLTESMRKDPDFKEEDGTRLSFRDKSFDFVVSLDVYEHIASLDREKFLSELCRVSKKGCIISFPQSEIYVKDAEERVNEYFKIMSGQDFIWLKEHRENGLPDVGKVNTFLDSTKYKYFSFCHGDIKIFEKMWYCHFDTVFAPEISEYRKNIDRYYNLFLYKKDISNHCYRIFYIISPNDIEEWEEYINSFFETDGDCKEKNFFELLLQRHKNLFDDSRRRAATDVIQQRLLDMQQKYEKYEHLSSQVREMKAAKEQAEREREQAEHNYETAKAAFLDISNSRIWRATKPVRSVLDWLRGK